ncbi:MAG: MASE1 domain-containing protein [Chloroflexi bacterium]|nr:MASE1 domain-containing protein [Chloroflexota bacterium]
MPKSQRTKEFGFYLLKILGLAVIYHLAARLGLSMAYVQANTSPVWPPTGISIAALLLFGTNLWPGVSLGVLLGSLLTGAPLDLALGMMLGNTLEAWIIAVVLKKVADFQPGINRVQDVIRLLTAAFFGTMISASLGALTLMVTGLGVWKFFPTIWVTWWIGDLLGAMVVAPVLFVWISSPSLNLNRRAYLEGAIQLSLLCFITWYVFSNQPPAGILHQALLYVIFPFMIWGALRFGQHGASTAILLVSGIAIWGTANGMGPFSLESKNESLVLLQTFMGVVSLTMLILAAATVERRKVSESLHQRVIDLATLNDSSKTFLDNFEIQRLYQTICYLAVDRLGLDAAWIEINNDPSPAGYHGISFNQIPSLRHLWEEENSDTANKQVIIRRSDQISTEPDDFQAFAVTPLIFSDEIIGVLKVLSGDREFFSTERLPLIQSFANLAAVAIQNTWLLDEVQSSNKQLHALSQRLLQAQEDERLHLSREIHDESGQLLAALSVQLGLLEREAGHHEVVSQSMDDLKRTAGELQDKLHQMAVDLRPASLDHLGLVTALSQYMEEFSRQYNLVAEFDAVGMEGQRLPGEVETAIYRIVQESLTNVVLHAEAHRVDVLLNLRDDLLIAIIEDDGVGFRPTSPTLDSQLGLFGMRERVEMLGGKMVIESAPGKGTTISVEVPCVN